MRRKASMSWTGCEGDSRTNWPLDTFPTKSWGSLDESFSPSETFPLAEHIWDILLAVLPSPSFRQPRFTHSDDCNSLYSWLAFKTYSVQDYCLNQVHLDNVHSVSFTDIELRFGVVIAEWHLLHPLKVIFKVRLKWLQLSFITL